MENTLCGNCPLGTKKQVVGNGVTEPPYMTVVRCPYDNEYYKDPDDECEVSTFGDKERQYGQHQFGGY